MKLPIRLVPKSRPPKFIYTQKISLPQGGTQEVEYESCVAPSMEGPLCELLDIVQKLMDENFALKVGKK